MYIMFKLPPYASIMIVSYAFYNKLDYMYLKPPLTALFIQIPMRMLFKSKTHHYMYHIYKSHFYNYSLQIIIRRHVCLTKKNHSEEVHDNY